ncbi:MAG: hypothetical protein QM679_01840 [Patulibacter sp.]
MNGDRQLRALAALSSVATLTVLLGASGSGSELARAAAAAFAPRPVSVAATVPQADTADTARHGDPSSTHAATAAAPSGNADGAGNASDTIANSEGESSINDEASEDPETTDTADATTATTPGDRTASNIKHIFVITLAGQGYDATFGSGSAATYLNGTLRPKGTLLANFSSLSGSGIADRLAMVSGQPPNAATKAGCTTYSQIPPLTNPDDDGVITATGCLYPNTIVTVGEQIQGRRLTWKGYAEDLDQGPSGGATTCRRPNPDQPDDTIDPRPGDTYATRNVPWVYFRSLIEVANCDSGMTPLATLTTDLATATTTPNFAFISPGSCTDGSHPACADGQPGGLAAADAFLERTVPAILASAAYQQDGLLLITFAGGPGGTDAATNNGALVLSRFATAGSTVSTAYDPYSLLKTVEDLFALPKYLANANDATSFADDVLAAAQPPKPGDD